MNTKNINNIFAPLTAMVDEACKEQTEREHIDVTMKGNYIPWPKIDWEKSLPAPKGWGEIEIEITAADCNAAQLTSSPQVKALRPSHDLVWTVYSIIVCVLKIIIFLSHLKIPRPKAWGFFFAFFSLDKSDIYEYYKL